MSLAPHPYVEHVLDLYRYTQGTTGHVRAADRRLAHTLADRGIPLQIIRDALVLAAARRTFRRQHAPPLPPIRSLHYILPLIDEILADPPDPAYFHYLRQQLAAPATPPAASDPQLP